MLAITTVAVIFGGAHALMEDQPAWQGCMAAPAACLMLEVYGPNSVDGTIPSEIGLLTNLQRLTVYNAQVSGTIPEEIGALTDLTMLNFHNNFVTGQIPSSIGNLTNLVYFYGYKNQLEGTIPEAFANLQQLESLFLSSNNITGTIPKVLGNITSLYQFSVHDNSLTGTVPSELGKMYKAMAFFLSSNNLTGPLPDEVKALVATGKPKWSVCNNPNLTLTDLEDPLDGMGICDHVMRRQLLGDTSMGARVPLRGAAAVASLGLALFYTLL